MVSQEIIQISERDDIMDCTEDIEVYEKGKTWECSCGQGFGTKMGTRLLKCPTCGKTLGDSKADQREYEPEFEQPEEGQSTLGGW